MDPFNEFIRELKSSLAAIQLLHSSWLRNPDDYTYSELRANLATITIDLEEISGSVTAIERDSVLAARLKLSTIEISKRRKELERFETEIGIIRASVGSSEQGLDSRRSSAAKPTPYTYQKEEEEEDLHGEFEREQQSLLMERQDSVLGSVSSTVGMLRMQAKAMGREVFEQNIMLDDLDHSIDSTSRRLAGAQKKMTSFISEQSSSPASWCIFLLIAVLIILLFCILFI